MGCRVSEHHTLIHELLRAANQLPSLNVSEKASLIDRAMAALFELRQEAYARHVDVHDVIDLKPCFRRSYPSFLKSLTVSERGIAPHR